MVKLSGARVVSVGCVICLCLIKSNVWSEGEYSKEPGVNNVNPGFNRMPLMAGWWTVFIIASF